MEKCMDKVNIIHCMELSHAIKYNIDTEGY